MIDCNEVETKSFSFDCPKDDKKYKRFLVEIIKVNSWQINKIIVETKAGARKPLWAKESDGEDRLLSTLTDIRRGNKKVFLHILKALTDRNFDNNCTTQ